MAQKYGIDVAHYNFDIPIFVVAGS